MGATFNTLGRRGKRRRSRFALGKFDKLHSIESRKTCSPLQTPTPPIQRKYKCSGDISCALCAIHPLQESSAVVCMLHTQPTSAQCARA